jgi:hypothetical protein
MHNVWMSLCVKTSQKLHSLIALALAFHHHRPNLFFSFVLSVSSSTAASIVPPRTYVLHASSPTFIIPTAFSPQGSLIAAHLSHPILESLADKGGQDEFDGLFGHQLRALSGISQGTDLRKQTQTWCSLHELPSFCSYPLGIEIEKKEYNALQAHLLPRLFHAS